MTRNQPGTRREQGHYDNQKRHAAALIQRHNPGWLVMYGPWSRRLWAYSTLPAPPGQAVVLRAPDPRDLIAQIRDAEDAATARPASRPPRLQEQGRHPMTPHGPALAGRAGSARP